MAPAEEQNLAKQMRELQTQVKEIHEALIGDYKERGLLVRVDRLEERQTRTEKVQEGHGVQLQELQALRWKIWGAATVLGALGAAGGSVVVNLLGA